MKIQLVDDRLLHPFTIQASRRSSRIAVLSLNTVPAGRSTREQPHQRKFCGDAAGLNGDAENGFLA